MTHTPTTTPQGSPQTAGGINPELLTTAEAARLASKSSKAGVPTKHGPPAMPIEGE